MRDLDKEMAEMKASTESMLAELATGEPVVVTGVLSSGPTGVSFGSDDVIYMDLWLKPWREERGELRTSRLNVMRRALSDQELYEFQERVSEFQVLKLRGRLLLEGEKRPEPRLLLEAVEGVGVQDDPELSRLSLAASQPVELRDPLLGRLFLDRSMGFFLGKKRKGRTRLDLAVEEVEGGAGEAALAALREAWGTMRSWEGTWRAFAAQHLLDTWNENWRPEGAAEIDADQLAGQLEVHSLLARNDGMLEVEFAAGRLFLGHGVTVRGRVEAGPSGCELT